jgi:4-hydroxybenzoate polyprenyltransferase
MNLPATAGETAPAPAAAAESVEGDRPLSPPAPARTLGGTARALLASLRPRQWPKNAVVLVGLVFAREAGDPAQVFRALAAAALFCLMSGAVYLANDLRDAPRDRLHPTKRHRPIASGALSPAVAAGAAAALVVGGLAAAVWLSPAFGAVALAYLLLQGAYVGGLKDAVLLDVLVLAGGFVLRAVAGAVVVSVPISPWLYVCTLLLALFLALGKRRQELVLLATDAGGHRPALAQYTVPLLDQLLQVVTTSLLVAYMLYTFFAENLPRNRAMMLTIPLVLYGLFRYLYLVHARGEGGAPEEVLLRDRPLAVTLILWALASAAILYVVPRG